MEEPIRPDVSGQRSGVSVGSGSLISFFAGKKTYLVGTLGLLYAAGVYFGWWNNESEIWGALGFTGAMTIRAAIAKLCATIANDPAFRIVLLLALCVFTHIRAVLVFALCLAMHFRIVLLLALLLPLVLLSSCAEYGARVVDKHGNEYAASYKPGQRDPLAGFVK